MESHSLNRISNLLVRNYNALKLGITFLRAEHFRIPTKIWFKKKYFDLKIPDEDSQKTAFIEIFLDDCYGLKKLRKKRIQIKTIIDIGANIGLFGIAARVNFPEARIYCFEPNFNIEPVLKYHSKIFNFNYSTKAVSNTEGKVSISPNQDSVLIRTSDDLYGSIEKISMKNIINSFQHEIDLLKMDCEGAEWEILFSEIDWEKIKNITMEYHLFEEKNTLKVLKKRLKYLGFKINYLLKLKGYGIIHASRK